MACCLYTWLAPKPSCWPLMRKNDHSINTSLRLYCCPHKTYIAAVARVLRQDSKPLLQADDCKTSCLACASGLTALFSKPYSEVDGCKTLCLACAGGLTALFSKRNIRPLLIGSSLMLFQQITGQPSVLYYAAKIFKDAGFASDADATRVSVVLGFFKLVMTGLILVVPIVFAVFAVVTFPHLKSTSSLPGHTSTLISKTFQSMLSVSRCSSSA